MTTIIYRREALLQDIADLAFVEADVISERHSPHELHQLLDICEEDNLPLTLRMLGLAFSEVLVILREICVSPPPRDTLSDADIPPEDFILPLKEGVPHIMAIRLKEAVHAFLVAFVLRRIMAMVDTGRAAEWKKHCDDALASMQGGAAAAAAGTETIRRPLSPF